MPYSVDSDNLPSNVKALAPNLKRLWVRVWNSIYSRTQDEGAAARGANAMVKQAQSSGSEELSEDAIEAFIDDITAEKPSRAYLQRVRDRLADLVRGGKLTKQDADEVINHARGVAGAAARTRKRKRRMSEVYDYRLVYDFDFAETPGVINVLPKPGNYKHPSYGTIEVTKERNAAFVDNFTNRVYQDKLPIDLEHETKLSGAVGWITGLYQNSDGSVDANVDWNDRGKEAIESDRFKYFSPEWYDNWTRPDDGKKIADVLIGGALTTRPFFKDQALRPLVASEMEPVEGVSDEGDDDWDLDYEFVELPEGVSYEDFRSRLQHALNERFPGATRDVYGTPWVSDVYKDYLIYCEGSSGVYYRVPFEISGGEVVLGVATAVERMTMWRPVVLMEPKEKVAGPDDDTAMLARTKPAMGKEVELDEKEIQKLIEENPQLKSMSERLQALEGADERLKAAEAAVTASQEEAKTYQERVSSLEKDARARRFADLANGRGGESDGYRWHGPIDIHVSMLENMASAFGEDSEQFKSYVELQATNAKQLHESGLFKEVGVEAAKSAADATVQSKIAALVKTYKDENPKATEAEATDAVLQANPELYSEFTASENDRIRKGQPAVRG